MLLFEFSFKLINTELFYVPSVRITFISFRRETGEIAGHTRDVSMLRIVARKRYKSENCRMHTRVCDRMMDAAAAIIAAIGKITTVSKAHLEDHTRLGDPRLWLPLQTFKSLCRQCKCS